MDKVAPGILGATLGLSVAGCGGDEAPKVEDDGVESADDSDTAGVSDTMPGLTTGGETVDPTDATMPPTTDPSGGGTDDSTTSGPPPDPPIVWDFPEIPDAPDVVFCGAPDPVVCDHQDDDPWHAIGLNCPGGPQVDATYEGADDQLFVHQGDLGTFVPAPFPPREGEKMVIISSGVAEDAAIEGTFASTDVVGGPYPGPLPVPPSPLQTNAVSATEDCIDNAGLVGTGDCSNSIEGQWSQSGPGGAFDMAIMRFTAEVPNATFGFTYDFAFFSTEYPDWYHVPLGGIFFNDIFIAWLESEQWTGNISFDEMGNPISLNAGFLDYKDAPNPIDCAAPCTAPELEGTGFMTHAGTKWLTTTAPVTPGEEIEVVWAIMDLSDQILDSAVMIDNFLWSCEGGPPVTIPG